MALGTHEAPRADRTQAATPAARNRPAPRAATVPPPVPKPGPNDADHRIGTQLGNYFVHEVLGKGGMGFVYRAEHVKLGREVALKLLRGDYAKRKDAVSRFVQEAKTVNRIRHRNIVDVPDILELDDGTTCIVMELLRGQSLGKWARTGVDLPRALAVLVQICDGLSAAHAVGIVHRDLKPDNVFVMPTADGAELVKLLDFGVAKLLHREDEDVGFQTQAGSVIGTPAYMSPEQAGGMQIDHRSDIYSLGAIMYELFCGQPLFRGKSFGEFVRKHLTETPVPPRMTEGGAHLDERIEAVILRCLEKEPARRFADATELRDTLLQLLAAMDTRPGFAQHGTRTIQQIYAPSTGAHLASSGTHSSGLYGSESQAPFESEVRGGVPSWMWAAGAAVAVGLGVIAALWVAGRPASGDAAGHPARRAAGSGADPSSILVVNGDPSDYERIPPSERRRVEVRFDSLPSASIYESGRSAVLCRTPCVKTLDLGDGGPTERRTFVVKEEGHRDGRIEIDLTSPRPFGTVTLEPLEVAPEAVADPVEAPADSERRDRPKKKRGRRDDVRAVDDEPDDDEDVRVEEAPPSRIDRTDTLDPFRTKEP